MKYLCIILMFVPSLCNAQSGENANAVILCATASSIPADVNVIGGVAPGKWRLVTQLMNGQINVSRFQTKDACEAEIKKSEHQPTTQEEKAYSTYFAKKFSDDDPAAASSYLKIGTDIANIECLDW